MLNVRNDGWSRWFAIGVAAACLLASACGEDTSQKGSDENNATGDGDGDGDANGSGGKLAAGVAGKSCVAGSDTCGGGECADKLTGGTLGALSTPLPAPNGYCTTSCTSDAQCGEGGVCFGSLLGTRGECRRKCAGSGDCEQGQECATTNIEFDADAGIDLGQFEAADTCQPLPPVDQLGADQAGKTCKEDGDCGAGSCAESGNEAGGYCTGRCASDGDCGAGGLCISGIYGSAGSCREACSVDADCQNDAAGWGCGEVGGKKVCVRKPDPLPNGVVGKACAPETEDADCGPGMCREIGIAGERYQGGYCVGRCTADSDCGADGVCIGGSTCFKKCAAESECRAEYQCIKHPLVTNSPSTICYPKMRQSGGGSPDAG